MNDFYTSSNYDNIRYYASTDTRSNVYYLNARVQSHSFKDTLNGKPEDRWVDARQSSNSSSSDYIKGYSIFQPPAHAYLTDFKLMVGLFSAIYSPGHEYVISADEIDSDGNIINHLNLGNSSSNMKQLGTNDFLKGYNTTIPKLGTGNKIKVTHQAGLYHGYGSNTNNCRENPLYIAFPCDEFYDTEYHEVALYSQKNIDYDRIPDDFWETWDGDESALDQYSSGITCMLVPFDSEYMTPECIIGQVKCDTSGIPIEVINSQ